MTPFYRFGSGTFSRVREEVGGDGNHLKGVKGECMTRINELKSGGRCQNIGVYLSGLNKLPEVIFIWNDVIKTGP